MEVLNSIIKLVFGLTIAVLGGLLLWTTWRRKRSSLNLQGEIVGVHEEHDEQGQLFRPVIAYIDASGQKKKMLSDAAVRSMSKVEVGATLSVIVDPADPSKTATTATLRVFGVIGFALFAIGATVLYVAAAEMTFTVGTLGQVAIVIVLLAMGLTPLWRIIRMGKNPAIDAAVRAQKREQLAEALEESEELNANDLAVRISNEEQDRARLKDKAALIAHPICIVIGVALLVAYGPWSCGQLAFLARATAAEGLVVGNEYTSSRPSALALPISGYFATIEYRTVSGDKRKLRDWFALKHPQFDYGARVRVLYDEVSPAHALPDRGVWNWLPPTVILLLGAFLALHPFMQLLARLQGGRKTDALKA